jgi:aminoglycoside 3-N-acetyltransferase
MKTFLKKIKIVNSYLKLKKIKKTKELGIYNYKDIKTHIENFGIKKGDHIFIHSSLSKLGYIDGGSETIIKVLKDIIGTEGTLIFPSFCFPGGGLLSTISNENYLFDKKKEPSSVGKISETFRKKEGVFRSNHPTHSISAIGKHAEFLTKKHIETGSNFGEGTPFKKMLELNVKMLGLGVKLPMFTFFHCVEDLNLDLFPGLYHKNKRPVKVRINEKIKVFQIPYHDPYFITDRIEQNNLIEKYFTDYFMSAKILKTGIIGSGDSILITCKDFYKTTLDLAKNNKTIYKI